MKIEHRAFRGLTTRSAPKSSGYIGTLSGYAAVFNSPSEEFAGWDRPWIETIQPGAFQRSITEMPDVRALYQHEPAQIMARAPNTLRLKEDDKGLAIEIDLIDTELNRSVHKLVGSGVLDSMSFGFSVRAVKWEEGKERDTRTLLDVDLFEVSVVTWPAYPASSVGARGLAALSDDIETLRRERAQFIRSEPATPTLPPFTQSGARAARFGFRK